MCNYPSSDRRPIQTPFDFAAFLVELTCLISLSLAALPSHAQPTLAPDPKFWMPDGPVNAILVTNDTVYLGGDFSYVGPRTGPAGLFSQATGQLLAAPPRIEGSVKAIEPDGAGGWFIGGIFTRIGTAPMTNVAHLKSDLSLDTRWNANVQGGGSVNALLLDNGRLYIGGQFQRIAGQFQSGLAAVNATDGGLTSWNPQLGGSVNTMVIDNNLLYVGGSFFSVGNSNNQNLAAIRTDTALATAWKPDAEQQVFALKVSGTTVYVGGQFTTVGTRPRNRLAALDAGTGVATTWNPNPNGIVRALALTDTTVYVGGDFTAIGGQNRRGIGAVNRGNGAAQPFDLQIQTPSTPQNLVRTLLLQGNSLYVGGSFTNALGGLQRLLMAVDITSSQPITVPLASDFNGASFTSFGVNALASQGSTMFVGGEFQSLGGVLRQRAAALSRSTGGVLPWAPAFSGPVLSLASGTDRIFVGGSFTNLNSTNVVPGLVALDPASGARVLFPFQATAQFQDVSIRTLLSTVDKLYVGGNFSVVGGQQRRFVAAVDPATGAAIGSFDAGLGGGFAGVGSVVLAGDTLYVAGDFSTVSSQTRARLAAVAAASGALQNWSPNPDRSVDVLAASPDRLYVGGQFTQIGGVSFRNFAAFELADRSVSGVDAALPQFAGGVTAIGATATTLYVGGTFDSIGGEFRLNLGCLASFNASAYDWDPAPDQPPAVITLTDDLAFIGGPFRFLGRSPTNQVNGFLAVFPRGPRFLRTSLTSSNKLQLELTTGEGTDAVLQASPDFTNWTNIATNDTPGFRWTLELPTATPVRRYIRAVAR